MESREEAVMLLRLTSLKIVRGDFGFCTICPTSKAVVRAEISHGLIHLCEKCYRAAEQNAKKLAAKKRDRICGNFHPKGVQLTLERIKQWLQELFQRHRLLVIT